MSPIFFAPNARLFDKAGKGIDTRADREGGKIALTIRSRMQRTGRGSGFLKLAMGGG